MLQAQGNKPMKTYSIEVPPSATTELTGVALLVRDTIRGHVWDMACDKAGRPMAITRDGKPYPAMPVLLKPMHAFARRFLGVNPLSSQSPLTGAPSRAGKNRRQAHFSG